MWLFLYESGGGEVIMKFNNKTNRTFYNFFFLLLLVISKEKTWMPYNNSLVGLNIKTILQTNNRKGLSW